MENKSYKILHIEDNLSDAELIKIEIESSFPKAILHQTHNKNDFIKQLKNDYDIILSDYNIPEIEGLEIYNIAKQYHPNIPFIFVSGTIGEERAVDVLRSGITDYVLKGNIKKLPFTINRAIDEANEIREKNSIKEALKKSEHFKTAILNSLSTRIAVINGKGDLISANNAWINLVNQINPEFNPKNIFKTNYFKLITNFLDKKDVVAIKHGINQVLERKKNYFYHDYSFINNEEKKWYTIRVNNLEEEKGAVISHTNITIQKTAEEKIKLSEERYRNLIENSSEITCICSKDSVITYVSSSIKNIMGWESADLLGKNIFDFVHPEDINDATTKFNSIGKKTVLKYNTYRFITKYNKYRFLRFMITNHLDTPSIEGLVINIQDITELIKAENEKFFTIIKTEENERRRIANDLHDGLGQTIAAANMCINALGSYAKTQLDEEAYATFEIAKNLINQSAKETRLVSHNIMPRSLKEFGIYSCIDEILKNYAIMYKDISFKIESNIKESRLPEEIELTIFRIVQESINNSLKHSKATKINIKLNLINNDFILNIKDNGIGFSQTNIDNDGIGLMSINQRIAVIDGKLNIDSSPSKGTNISVVLKNVTLLN